MRPSQRPAVSGTSLQDYLELLRSSNPHFAQTGDPAHLKILSGLTF
jgi:23S rRNA (adenine2030-N6)-methyltransferase